MSNSGFFGVDPMMLLRARVTDPAASQGTAPVSAPPASAAATPPAASPVPSGGGGLFSNLGSRLGQAMSGERGLFAGAPDAAADAAIDPSTGAPVGLTRKATNQSIMKMGMMLIAAGQRQSDDSRAQILAGLGGAMDTSDTINNFARNRLEMAKIKILEREQLGQEQLRKTLGGMFGDTTAPASAATPPAATPLTAAPVGTGTGLVDPATAPVSMPAASPPVQAAPLAPLDAPSSRVAGAFDTTAPEGQPAAPPATPAPQVAASEPVMVAPAALPTKPPAPPAVGSFSMTPEQKQTGKLLIATDPTGKSALEYYTKLQADFASQEMSSEPYVSNGKILVDVYKSGRKVDVKTLGDAEQNARILVDPTTGETKVMKIGADGAVKDYKIERDPVRDAARQRENELANPDIPSGFMRDPNDPTGRAIIERPGSAEEQKRKATERAKSVEQSNKDNSARVVTDSIDRIFGTLEEAKGNLIDNGAGSFITQGLARLPGSSSQVVGDALATVKANTTVQALNSMRAASPTGSALGSMTDRDVQLLSDLTGELNQSGNPDVFRYNLARIKNTTLDLVHGVGNGPERIDLDSMAGSPKKLAQPDFNKSSDAPRVRRYNPQTDSFE